VTNLNDAGMGSLRDAIASTPAGGIVDFQPGLTGTITLTTGELAITKDLTIAGPGADVITVSGNHASRVFDIPGPVTVALAGLTVANGSAAGDGGGIAAGQGSRLTVTGTVISGNACSNYSFGGGVSYLDLSGTGQLTIVHSTICGNFADLDGGGLEVEFGSALVVDSTISNNVCAVARGGIANLGLLTLTNCTVTGNRAQQAGGIGNGFSSAPISLAINNCTISGNSATGGVTTAGYGGGIYSGEPLTVTDSTIAGNTATDDGGGIYNSGGPLTVTDSILSGNTAMISGGGIYNDFGNVTVTGSTISGNSAIGFGGGIFNAAGHQLTITNSTLSGNTANSGSGIYNSGMFAVRGIVTIDGDYFQTATGTLRLHIGGTQAGSQYDQLVVNGLATLDGTLAVALAKGFRPHSGDQFQVLVAGGVQGAFRRTVWNALARFTLDYADGLTLVAN
jgi:hypothetical protein